MIKYNGKATTVSGILAELICESRNLAGYGFDCTQNCAACFMEFDYDNSPEQVEAIFKLLYDSVPTKVTKASS